MLVYKDMCRSPWWRAQANRLQDLLIAREWINYVPVQTVEQWAAEDGMKVRVREEMNRFWCGHERRVKKIAQKAPWCTYFVRICSKALPWDQSTISMLPPSARTFSGTQPYPGVK